MTESSAIPVCPVHDELMQLEGFKPGVLGAGWLRGDPALAMPCHALRRAGSERRAELTESEGWTSVATQATVATLII